MNRRNSGLLLPSALVSAIAGLFVSVPLAGGDEGAVAAVEAVGMTVGDLERATAFYTDVLSFERLGEVEVHGPAHERLQGVFGMRARIVRLRLGAEELELSEFLAPQGRRFPEDTRANDLWFQHIAIVVSDMSRAYEHLRSHRVRHASSAPQRLPEWNPDAGGIEAFYFRDPEGHFLELIRFPPGKGDPRWQEPTDRLFLGIDHTAVVVSDTEASLRFYRDALGLELAGASENHGIEQEHLNSVFGARLRITVLRSSRGPGIELLEYLAPAGGRPRPLEARANDLLYWQTTLAVSEADAAARRLRAFRAAWTSPGVVEIPDRSLGFRRAMLVADPDGHAIRLVEREDTYHANRGEDGER